MLRLLVPKSPNQEEIREQENRKLLSGVTVPLDRAMLCLDCESIYEAKGPCKCPACGGSAAWAVGRALNRTSEAKAGVS